MKKIILRKAKLDDLDSMWNNIWQDKELAKFMLWKPVENIEEAKIRLQKTIEYQTSNLAFYICLEETDEVIGFLGAVNTGDSIFEDTGICIASKYQGNGYGKQALQLLLEIIFEELDGKEFIYSCFEENKKSQKLCESLGFEYKYAKQNTRKWDNLNYTAKYYSIKAGE
jgi:RimJ/RimL family protein N-acetyltransferase